jgi:hypothetical protein
MQIDGAADADRLLAQLSESDLELARVLEEGIEQLEHASLSARVKRYLESIPDRYRCSTEEGQHSLIGQINALIRAVIPLIENCDSRGVDRRLGEFERAASSAAAMTAPQPALMPSIARFRELGWSSADAGDLQMVLLIGMCGVVKGSGDHVVEIDADSVKLSSGLRLSKAAIIQANQPASQVGR